MCNVKCVTHSEEPTENYDMTQLTQFPSAV